MVARKKGPITRHHRCFPKKEYSGNVIERRFRVLPQNMVDMYEETHSNFHKHNPPPKKPTFEEMFEAVLSDEIERERRKRSQIEPGRLKKATKIAVLALYSTTLSQERKLPS